MTQLFKNMMMQKDRHKVLIVDDSIDNIKICVNLLSKDYDTFFAKDGKKALEMVYENRPDIILLDIVMPEIDGYEVCKRLKSDEDEKVKDIPVVFISSKNQVEDETKGLDLGAVDYITKPISPPILKARIRNHLKLSHAMEEIKLLYSMALDASPLTGLPGNNSIAKKIESAIQNKEQVCVVYSDLDNFKAFNDKYGFAKGDQIILLNGYVMQVALRSHGLSNSFIGHIGGDDFVMVIPIEKVQDVIQSVIFMFDDGVIKFYTPEDAQRKSIVSLNRQGEVQTFPIISISMAGVDLTTSNYSKYIEVNDACSETKKKAKAVEGSCFVMDKRGIMKFT